MEESEDEKIPKMQVSDYGRIRRWRNPDVPDVVDIEPVRGLSHKDINFVH